MEIRIEGVLKSWNKERGFGFITPISGGGQDIFVHVSDFACKGGGRWAVGEWGASPSPDKGRAGEGFGGG